MSQENSRKRKQPEPEGNFPQDAGAMPAVEGISKEMRDELVKLANEKGQEKLQEQLKRLVVLGEITEELLFDFLGTKKPDEKTYIVSDSSINKLGILLSKEKNAKLQKLEIMLYELSAKRGSAIGAYNFASMLFYGISKDIEQALSHVNFAINKGIDGYFLRGGIWEKKEKYIKAIQDYLKVKDTDDLIPAAKEINKIASFIARSKSGQSDKKLWIEVDEWYQSLSASKDEELKNKLHYIMGLIYYYTGDYKNAMLQFVEIPKKDPWYAETTFFKKDCYLRKGKAILGIKNDEDVEEKKEEDDSIDVVPLLAAEDSSTVILSDGLVGRISFSKAWRKSDVQPHYDLVDTPVLDQVKSAWQSMLDLAKKALQGRDALVAKGLELEGKKIISTEEGFPKAAKLLEDAEKSLALQQKKINKAVDVHTPNGRRRVRRSKTEARYFDPLKAKKKDELFDTYKKILDARFGSGKGVLPLDGLNARQVYRAERLFQQVGIEFLSAAKVGDYAMNLGIPHDSDAIKGSSKMGYADRGAGPVEHWQAGEYKVEVVHAITPSRERLGNIFLPKHRTYDDLLGYLNKITGDDAQTKRTNEQTLAKYMIRYTYEFKPATLEELQAINPEATKEMVNQFHTVCLLVGVKEQTQWLSSEGEDYKTGLAVAQARSLILLREGYLTFKDVFKREAEFGVFSQVSLLKYFYKVEDAVKKIEKIYMEHVKALKYKEYATFFARYPNHEMVLTRQQARADLREVYGGAESDSDDGYESDIAYDKHKHSGP
jgi:hypothetical protein